MDCLEDTETSFIEDVKHIFEIADELHRDTSFDYDEEKTNAEIDYIMGFMYDFYSGPLFEETEKEDNAMKFSRRNKFGIRSGNTFRFGRVRNWYRHSNRHLHTITKTVFVSDSPPPRDSEKFAELADLSDSILDDGLHLNSLHWSHMVLSRTNVEMSLNKKKRWLLPDLIRDAVDAAKEEASEFSDNAYVLPYKVTLIEGLNSASRGSRFHSIEDLVVGYHDSDAANSHVRPSKKAGGTLGSMKEKASGKVSELSAELRGRLAKRARLRKNTRGVQRSKRSRTEKSSFTDWNFDRHRLRNQVYLDETDINPIENEPLKTEIQYHVGYPGSLIAHKCFTDDSHKVKYDWNFRFNHPRKSLKKLKKSFRFNRVSNSDLRKDCAADATEWRLNDVDDNELQTDAVNDDDLVDRVDFSKSYHIDDFCRPPPPPSSAAWKRKNREKRGSGSRVVAIGNVASSSAAKRYGKGTTVYDETSESFGRSELSAYREEDVEMDEKSFVFVVDGSTSDFFANDEFFESSETSGHDDVVFAGDFIRSDVGAASLSTMFADGYEESASFPRKFLVDLSSSCREKNGTVVDENRTFVNENRRPSIKENRTIVDEKRTFVDEKRTFVDENRTFVDESYAFVDENRTFVDENRTIESYTFVDENCTFVDANRTFVDDSGSEVVVKNGAGDANIGALLLCEELKNQVAESHNFTSTQVDSVYLRIRLIGRFSDDFYQTLKDNLKSVASDKHLRFADICRRVIASLNAHEYKKESLCAVTAIASSRAPSHYFLSKACHWSVKSCDKNEICQIVERERKSDVSSLHVSPATTIISQIPDFCDICLDTMVTSGDTEESDRMALKKCGHWFCRSCWKRHIVVSIDERNIEMFCPAVNCRIPVDFVTLVSLVPSSYVEKYTRFRNDACLDKQLTRWSRCTNSKCETIVEVTGRFNNRSNMSVECQCGNCWCLICRCLPHWPANCEQSLLYDNMRSQERDDYRPSKSEITIVNFKRCPGCKYPIEKNGGCPHMHCQMCQKAFCWECRGDIYQHDAEICSKRNTALEVIQIDSSMDVVVRQSFYKMAVEQRWKRVVWTPSCLIRKLSAIVHRLSHRGRNGCHGNNWQTSLLSKFLLVPTCLANDLNSVKVVEIQNVQNAVDYFEFLWTAAFLYLEVRFVLEYTYVLLSSVTNRQKLRGTIQNNLNLLRFAADRLENLLFTTPNRTEASRHVENVKMYVKLCTTSLSELASKFSHLKATS